MPISYKFYPYNIKKLNQVIIYSYYIKEIFFNYYCMPIDYILLKLLYLGLRV